MRRTLTFCLIIAIGTLGLTGCNSHEHVNHFETQYSQIISRIDQITLYQNGVAKEISTGEDIPDILLMTLHNLSLETKNVFDYETINEIQEKDRVLKLVFSEPITVTISRFIELTDRDHITTNADGYQMLEKVKSAIFILDQEPNEGLEGHVLVGSAYQEEILYRCWAVQQKKSRELERSWCTDLSNILNSRLAETSLEESRAIAEKFVLNSPTFKFDGVEDSLQLLATHKGQNPTCWQFKFEFQCRHAGYGDRADHTVTKISASRIARIAVKDWKVVSAIIDNQWDMIEQRLIGKGAIESAEACKNEEET